jgi:cytochrome c-type biogenesis protein CcmH
MERRDFLARLAPGVAAVLVSPRLLAQSGTPAQDSAAPAQGTTSNLFDMNQTAAKTVRRPPKPGAVPTMTPDERDALEQQIRCQCGCTLDVYICRTTDFSCQVSPAMHRDVISLVEGGYSADEILDAFVDTYGERALMAPKREGFNLAGYLVPFATIGIGAAVLAGMLRRMRHRAALASAAARSGAAASVAASVDELAKLEAAIRKDE